tara:strand:- start:1688 stop:2317 length:630 start_codon:yes stop_codon:yes gene_type:complete
MIAVAGLILSALLRPLLVWNYTRVITAWCPDPSATIAMIITSRIRKTSEMAKILTSLAGVFAIGLSITATVALAETPDTDSQIMVFKTPWCGCCQAWVEAMEQAGYDVKTTDVEDLTAIKTRAGVPGGLEACHTAMIGGETKYVLEGHVPIEAVEKLMTERPDIRGVSTPGMPMGSLGMGDVPEANYTVYAFTGRYGEEPAVYFEVGKQ